MPYFVFFRNSFYFPFFFDYSPDLFGENVLPEIDYQELKRKTENEKKNFFLFPPVPFDPTEPVDLLSSPPPTPPSLCNWFGTDDRGRDLLARILFAFRNSFLLAFFSSVIVVFLAFIIGSCQAYWQGWVDLIIGRVLEIWVSLPILPLILLTGSVFRFDLNSLSIFFALFSWIPLSQQIRALGLKIKGEDFFLAAEMIGLKKGRILFYYILPNVVSLIIPKFPFLMARFIIGLSILSYLGLGIVSTNPTLGEILQQSRNNMSCWWLTLIPFTVFVTPLILLNIIGGALRNAFDQKFFNEIKYNENINY